MYCIRRAFLRLTKSCLKLYFCFLPLAALYEYKSYNYRRDRSKAHGDSDTVEAEIKHAHKQVTIALVGKYTGLHDAYLSVVESLFHAGTACDANVEIQWVDSETLTSDNIAQKLCGCSGILVPGGFGDRGIEGMILAAQYARERGVPYLGICLGMQIAVIEFARHVLGWDDATRRSNTTAGPPRKNPDTGSAPSSIPNYPN